MKFKFTQYAIALSLLVVSMAIINTISHNRYLHWSGMLAYWSGLWIGHLYHEN